MYFDYIVKWEASAVAQLDKLADIDREVETLMDDLCRDFGDEGVKFIRPEVKGNGRWQPSTGATAAGIDYEVVRSGGGRTLYFLGTNMSDDGRHNVATLIDVGNFPANQPLYAASYGLKAFPISARVGATTDYLAVIHGMGHTSGEYPKFFSDKALDYLHKNVPSIAEQAMDAFLDRLVM